MYYFSYHNKIPQIGWLKEQVFISYIFGVWKSEVRMPDCQVHGEGPSPLFTDGCLLVVTSCGKEKNHLSSLSS